MLGMAGMMGACDDLSPPVTRSKTTPPVAPVKNEVPPTPPTPPSPPEAMLPRLSPPTEVIKVAPPDSKKDGDEASLPNDPLEAARKLLAAGENSKALKLAKSAVGKQPDRSAAWNTLGRAELQVGHREEALEAFEKAVELNPRNGYAHNNFGLALIYDKRFDDAVEKLEQAVELEPVESYMWNNLGTAYEQLDRLDDARDAYSKAAEMKSDRGRESLARLKGVKTLIRTAKVESGPSTESSKN
ncbi:MAG TPA: tetratricopeptide repeat protein [Polyangia bacterium]|nr:tetratricopeptide repeat protein [Polyangia bacterium]